MEKKVSGSSPGLARLEIEEAAKSGAGVAWVRSEDGLRRVFVEGALPGDLVEARVAPLRKGAHSLEGKLVRVLSPAAGRRNPPCPAARACGGCPLGGLTPPAQRAARKRLLGKLFHEGGFPDAVIGDVLGMEGDREEGFRNKSILYFSGAGGALRLGMYRAGTHEVAEGTLRCPQCPEWMGNAAEAVLAWARRSGLSASPTGQLFSLLMRAGTRGRLAALTVTSPLGETVGEDLASSLRNAGLTGAVVSLKSRSGNFALGDESRVLFGCGSVEAEIEGASFEVRPETFLQVNTPMTPVLYRIAIGVARAAKGSLVLDLYCGVGTISLLLAREAARVVGVEVVPSSVEEARRNAERNGAANAEFVCGPAEVVLPELSRAGLRPASVFVDPPRKGLAPGVPAVIAGMAPEEVVYIACGPEALVRDAAAFRELGYGLGEVVPVDLFPGTLHVETVARFARKPGS